MACHYYRDPPRILLDRRRNMEHNTRWRIGWPVPLCVD
jgi:hypothetical protein